MDLGEFVIAKTRLEELPKIAELVKGLPTIELWKDSNHRATPVLSGMGGEQLRINPLEGPLWSVTIKDEESPYRLIASSNQHDMCGDVSFTHSTYRIEPQTPDNSSPYTQLFITRAPNSFLMERVFVEPKELDELDRLGEERRDMLIRHLKEMGYF